MKITHYTQCRLLAVMIANRRAGPANPYTRGDYYGRDSCHKLAVGVLANLYSYEFIAGALSVEEQTTVTVDEVKWMKSHPDFSVPAILFLEQERFTDDSRVYFYAQLQKAKTDSFVADISYTGVFLNYHFELDENLAAYVWLTTEATQNELEQMMDFLAANEFSQQSIAFVVDTVDYLMTHPQSDLNLGNYFNLVTHIKSDANYLLKYYSLTETTGDFSNWQDLLQYDIPQAVKDKIEYLKQHNNEAWDLQLIENANGVNVNLDYFPVKITQLPNKPFAYFPYANGE